MYGVIMRMVQHRANWVSSNKHLRLLYQFIMTGFCVPYVDMHCLSTCCRERCCRYCSNFSSY